MLHSNEGSVSMIMFGAQLFECSVNAMYSPHRRMKRIRMVDYIEVDEIIVPDDNLVGQNITEVIACSTCSTAYPGIALDSIRAALKHYLSSACSSEYNSAR